MRFLLAVATLAALNTAAVAAPWANNEITYDDSESVYIAYQVSNAAKDYTLEYECDGEWQFDAFAVVTPEPYDATASYAKSVPTQFIVDGGSPVEMNGVFTERSGQVVALYDSMDAYDEFSAVLEAVQAAKSSIRVKFFDRDISFSAEGVRPALLEASVACY